MDALMDNYIALVYAILTDAKIDKALMKFNLLDADVKAKDLRKIECEDMIIYRDSHNMTYQEIGKLFELKANTVWRRLERFEKKGDNNF